MKLSSRSLLAATVVLASHSAWSADTYLNVFFDAAPMQGIGVKFNGKELGMTDARGSASAFTPAGEHKIQLLREGVVLTTIDFKTAEDEDAEISITFSDDVDTPEIKISKFASDDKSASGLLGGIVTDRYGAAIEGAIVEDEDGNELGSTNASGAYEIELPRGDYSFRVSHPEYSSASMDDIRVLANLGVVANVKLSPRPAGIDISLPILQGPIEEVLTLGTYKPTDSALGLERFSTDVIDAIDVEQLARFGDSDVASALTRLVGVSVTGGKYANVRGLDGRYISSSLNGFLMPSTDPLRRDVQLDLFPAGVLDGVEVQKSYSSDLLGSTTGGSLGIRTKGLPEDRVAKFKVKFGGNTDITGDEIATYEGSNGDWLGFDSGLRDLSQDVLDATENGTALRGSLPIGNSEGDIRPEIAAAYAVTFEDDYNVKTKEANPEFDIALSYGDITDDGIFGYYGSISYSYGTSVRVDATRSDPLDLTGEYDRSEESYSLDSYFVFGSNFRTEDEVLSKTILLRDSENVTRRESTIDKEDNDVDEVVLEWTERQFFAQQFEGKHAFDFGATTHELDWGISFANTDLYQPDRRAYEYLSGFLILGTLERRWFDLNEDSIDIRADYSLPIEFTNSFATEFQFGVLSSDKSREVEQYRFTWSTGDGPSANNPITIEDNLEEVFGYYQFALDNYRLAPNSTETDSFNADEEITAFYINTVTTIGDWWTITLGGRQEDYMQGFSYPNAGDRFECNTSDPEDPDCPLDESNFLPALSLSFAPGDSWQFRAAASQTVSYPGLIERSRARLYDPETGDELVGNPGLFPSTIDNIDFRIEYYFSDDESISLAFFNKEISDPIEKSVLDGSGSSVRGFTYRQSESATLNGIELDGRFTMFETSDWLGFISGNLTYIESEVTLAGRGLDLEGDANQGRELQGQSPYLANLQIGFDHFPLEQKFTFLVNYFDDRIDKINRVPRSPVYEVGRTEVNFNYEKLFGESFTVKAQLKNLLNEEVQFRIGDLIIESYSEGIEYSIDLSWEL